MRGQGGKRNAQKQFLFAPRIFRQHHFKACKNCAEHCGTVALAKRFEAFENLVTHRPLREPQLKAVNRTRGSGSASSLRAVATTRTANNSSGTPGQILILNIERWQAGRLSNQQHFISCGSFWSKNQTVCNTMQNHVAKGKTKNMFFFLQAQKFKSREQRACGKVIGLANQLVMSLFHKHCLLFFAVCREINCP